MESDKGHGKLSAGRYRTCSSRQPTSSCFEDELWMVQRAASALWTGSVHRMVALSSASWFHLNHWTTGSCSNTPRGPCTSHQTTTSPTSVFGVRLSSTKSRQSLYDLLLWMQGSCEGLGASGKLVRRWCHVFYYHGQSALGTTCCLRQW